MLLACLTLLPHSVSYYQAGVCGLSIPLFSLFHIVWVSHTCRPPECYTSITYLVVVWHNNQGSKLDVSPLSYVTTLTYVLQWMFQSFMWPECRICCYIWPGHHFTFAVYISLVCHVAWVSHVLQWTFHRHCIWPEYHVRVCVCVYIESMLCERVSHMCITYVTTISGALVVRSDLKCCTITFPVASQPSLDNCQDSQVCGVCGTRLCDAVS